MILQIKREFKNETLKKEYMHTVPTVQKLLKENTKWIDRYKEYADILIENHDFISKMSKK